ncbi:MAG: Spy/CpxP family protein refolding chaperone [Pyrinomonadaceae bacterium]
MFLRKSVISVSGLILILASVAVAQEAQPQSPTTPDARMKTRLEGSARRGELGNRRGGMRHRGGIGRHLMKELNLTDEQRQQARAIMQRRLAGTKAQREELLTLREKSIAGTFTADDEARAKALRQEMRAAMEGSRAEMERLLTAEQKAQLEQMKQDRKSKVEERRKRRQEFLNKNSQ